jgi:hypothetical protein
LDRLDGLGRRIRVATGSEDLELLKGVLHGADPLVSSLDLERSLLPVGLVLDVCGQVERRLSREVRDADVE